MKPGGLDFTRRSIFLAVRWALMVHANEWRTQASLAERYPIVVQPGRRA